MGSISIGLALDQVRAPAMMPLPDPFAVTLGADGTLQIVGNDGRSFVVDDPADFYDGSYSVDPVALAAGPVALVAPQLRALTVAEAGATLAITPALFAYDADLGPVTLSYTSNATNAIDASDPGNPTLLVDAADAETALMVTATATQAGVPVAQSTNTVTIAALPDPFAVTLGADGTLQIVGNDGRSFVVDDPADFYDGSYSVDPVALAAGPVALVAPQLRALTVAEAGATLAITPALFAYDADLGPVTLSYTSNATNAIDASDPGNPTLLVDAADAETALMVTATATQAGVPVAQSTNTVTIAALPDPFAVTLGADGTLQIVGNDGRSFVVDDPADFYDGSYSVDPVALAAGPVALVAPQLRALTVAEAGATLAITPALFAYDADLGPVTLSYTSNATNAIDASDPGNPTLLVDAADAETALMVTATATQAGVPVAQSTNTVTIAALPDPFAVTLGADGTLQIVGNDGRSFVVDDPADFYDGSYSVDPVALAAGPVALVAPQLRALTVAEAGATLAITPALFAYDADLGPVTLSYTSNATNAIDASDPDNPTLLVDAADAETALMVTATATQGMNVTNSQSNNLSILSIPVNTISATVVDLQGTQTFTSTPSFTLDLSGAGSGDRLVLVYGTGTTDEPSMTVGGVSVGASLANTGGNSAGARIWVFEYTLTGPGSASTPVALNLSSSRTRHMLTAAIVTGAVRDAVGADFQFNIGTASVSVTPTDAANAIVCIAMGRASFFGLHTWTNATQVGSVFSNTTGDRASAVAFADNVPVAPYSVSFDPDPSGNGNDEVALAVLSYSTV